jgi:hypothetical protein
MRHDTSRFDRLYRRSAALLFCLAVFTHGSAPARAADGPMSGATVNEGKTNIVIRPVADDSMLINPGKGWVQYYGADKIYTRDYIGVGYNRCAWSDFEPQENQFDWKAIDDFVKYFKVYGKKIGFGVISVSTGIGKEYVTPKWVFDAGAAPLAIPDSSTPTGRQIIPRHWNDPVFLEKLHEFIRALGKQYDGHPDIAFFDIRDYGNWGEGHIGGLGADPDIKLTSPENLKDNYLQPYITAFPHTRLIVPWGHDSYNGVYDWAVTQGVGIRRDGILSQWSKDGSECLRAFGHQPAIFEYCDNYSNTKKNGYWNTDLLMKYIQAGKPSYMQWDEQIFKENREFCLRLSNKVGYHFILQQAIIPGEIRATAPFQIQMQWLNDGVAFLYEPCTVAIALLDRNDKLVQKQWLTGSDPGSWKPDEPKTETLTATFPEMPAGTYKLAIGLFLDRDNATPAYRLGIRGRTATGWYVLYDKMECN